MATLGPGRGDEGIAQRGSWSTWARSTRPSHGVLRLIPRTRRGDRHPARSGIGYLHTGSRKNLEFRTWTQGVTYVTRMDYLAPIFSRDGLLPRRPKLLGITGQIPERATVIGDASGTQPHFQPPGGMPGHRWYDGTRCP